MLYMLSLSNRKSECASSVTQMQQKFKVMWHYKKICFSRYKNQNALIMGHKNQTGLVNGHETQNSFIEVLRHIKFVLES